MKRFMRLHGKILVSAALLCAAAGARAQNAHFVGKVTASLDNDTGDVQVCWKEAGLGNNVLVDYTASATTASATYVCVNNGGQCPNAANKITSTGPVSATGTFSSGQNGQINACLTINPPGAGSFTCPSGQTMTLASVSYTNIQVTDESNDVSAGATPSSLSATLFTCP
jgi:hypothetical protein